MNWSKKIQFFRSSSDFCVLLFTGFKLKVLKDQAKYFEAFKFIGLPPKGTYNAQVVAPGSLTVMLGEKMNLIDSSASQGYVFVGTQKAAQSIGYVQGSLKNLRRRGSLIEGIHWVRINRTTLRYNQPLLLDWLANRNDPEAHERAVNAFLLSLPSNQKKAQRIKHSSKKE